MENILHVDMDAFYASVEAIRDPSLEGRAVIVGGRGGRGVVTSASYAARAYGVHSAMPTVTARRLCPHGVFLPNDFDAYMEFSERIREVFLSFTPLVEPLSLDEAFLDVSGSVRLFGDSATIGRAIKSRISDLGLASTVGVAANKFLAKLASSTAKPDGFLVVASDEAAEWLRPLPVSALWGVGAQTAEALRRLGLRTVGDLRGVPRRTLERTLGDSLGAHLHALARGVDDRPVTPHEPPKSVGSEQTYESDLVADEAILREVLRLSDRTAGRLRAKGFCGRTVTLKLRWSDFTTITRSRTLAERVDTTPEIYEVARGLFRSFGSARMRVRLLGVTVTSLAAGPPARQAGLWEAGRPRWVEASDAVDRIRGRFGAGAVGPAALLDEPPDPGPQARREQG